MNTPDGISREQTDSPIPGERRTRRRQKSPNRGSVAAGKVWVVAIFFALTAVSVVMAVMAPKDERVLLLALLGCSAVWTTALLVGMWRRLDWARILLLGILIVSVIPCLIFVPAMLQSPNPDRPHIIGMSVAAVVYGGVAWLLASSKNIRRLTRPSGG